MKPMKFGVGQPVRRVEDVRLVTGRGAYTSDYSPEGALHAVFWRSPHADAKFRIADIEAARAMPGVRAIFTAADFAALGTLPVLAPIANADGAYPPTKPYPVMAKDEVFHVGDLVDMVVAESLLDARDAAEAIAIDWEPLPALAEMEAAIEPGAAAIFNGAGNNIAYDTHIGDKAETDAAFETAAHVATIKVVNQRVVANYLEPRSAVAEYDADNDRLTLHVGSQGVHTLRMVIAKRVLKIPEDKLRVVTQDVGGGFGTKAFAYREYPLLLEAARRLQRPVVWRADRTEHFVGDAQGRDNVTVAEMAMDSDGKFVALRVDVLGNLGGYPSQFAPYIPWLGASMATGPYDIGVVHARVRGVYTHTVPVDAYRGAGRPEAAYVLERLVDRCARVAGIEPPVIRAKNLIKSSQTPYRTPTNRTYDVGDFEGTLRRCLEKADYKGFAERADEARTRGHVRGIGISSYVECTAWGDGEAGSVILEKSGDFTVLIGTQSNGQGHETAYAQVVSQYLDVPLSRVRVVQGDTERVATGAGTGGSRSIPIGAVMVDGASRKLVASLKDLAADKLEAAAEDLEIADGHIRIAGTDRAVSYAELASLPTATVERRTGADSFKPPEATYPNGTHICEVEIDPETGLTRIVRYCVVDDFGFTLNPLLLEGQVHGGVAQGLGQALLEKAVYDSDGQLLTASLMDYCLPRADDLVSIEFETRNVPSTTNPMGLKGAGEAGSIGSTPAVMNAVGDALWRAYGIDHIDMPATPFAVARAIRRASGEKPAH
ncbi:MAG TPA: xanthine dehydrogenase family protein molybdopterin-binding subunit [Roseiarcus sp.]|nr:xanthine dehydrogenase family protein molybdopterin-binding subunit [Roseiarcus sp.]